MDNVRFVTSNNHRTFAITTNNELWGWGNNIHGELGVGTDKYKYYYPVKIMDNVKEVSIGDNHTIAVKNDGSLWGWGQNSYVSADTSVPVCLTTNAVFVTTDLDDIYMAKGQKKIINISTYPADGIFQNIRCISSNEDVAIVNDRGVVTAIGEGMAEITIEMTAGENIQTTTCNVYVSDEVASIQSISSEKKDEIIHIYTSDGVKVYKGRTMPSLPKGIYIIKSSSGVKKIKI